MAERTAALRPEAGIPVGDRYVLVREIARGGMGTVWEAQDGERAQPVAIKFQSSLLPDVMSERRFEREVAALCRLASPHVVTFLDSGSQGGLPYIVMERLMGETLRQRLASDGRFEPADAAKLVAQTAAGLEAAHAAGIVHRDVKPSNLFLAHTEQGEVLKIIDLGIAKPHGLGAEGDSTASGIVGSPAYMSPEQAKGEDVDPRTDTWALGVVAFKLLTGSEPFTEADVPATLQRICRGHSRLATRERPDLPEALNGFFRRAFMVERSRRFQTPRELAVMFERACRGEGPAVVGRTDDTQSIELSASMAAAPPRSRPFVGAAAFLAVAVAAVGAATFALKTEAVSAGSSAPEPELAPVSPKPVVAKAEPTPSATPVERSEPVAPPAPSAARPATVNARKSRPVSPVAPPVAPAAPPPRVTETAPAPTPAPVKAAPAVADPLDRRF